MAFFGLFNREKKETLDKGLEKSKESVLSKISHAIAGKSTIDDDVLDNLEEALIMSDVGVETTLRIIERIQERVKRDKYIGTAEFNALLVDEIADMLSEHDTEIRDFTEPLPAKPYVVMVVGVNGVGKTTTIGKLAYQYKKAGKKVYLGAADTFRAAAVVQLCIWGERVGVPVIKQQQGSDPASVAYDTIASANANDADVVLIDTAGRLHNKENLVRELQKIDRIAAQKTEPQYYKKLIVLDATTGQNALRQAEVFNEAVGVDAAVLTKYDSTSKGGIVVTLGRELGIPVAFVCTGETYKDIRPFSAEDFAEDFLGC